MWTILWYLWNAQVSRMLSCILIIFFGRKTYLMAQLKVPVLQEVRLQYMDKTLSLALIYTWSQSIPLWLVLDCKNNDECLKIFLRHVFLTMSALQMAEFVRRLALTSRIGSRFSLQYQQLSNVLRYITDKQIYKAPRVITYKQNYNAPRCNNLQANLQCSQVYN